MVIFYQNLVVAKIVEDRNLYMNKYLTFMTVFVTNITIVRVVIVVIEVTSALKRQP
jgi:hypothetical protein